MGKFSKQYPDSARRRFIRKRAKSWTQASVGLGTWNLRSSEIALWNSSQRFSGADNWQKRRCWKISDGGMHCSGFQMPPVDICSTCHRRPGGCMHDRHLRKLDTARLRTSVSLRTILHREWWRARFEDKTSLHQWEEQSTSVPERKPLSLFIHVFESLCQTNLWGKSWYVNVCASVPSSSSRLFMWKNWVKVVCSAAALDKMDARGSSGSNTTICCPGRWTFVRD